jgi:hypothetical protein
MRPDAVSPELAQAVFTRDRREVAAFMAVHPGPRESLTLAWTRWHGNTQTLKARVDAISNHPQGVTIKRVVCPAVVIDPDQYGQCWGRWRIEHVKSEPRLAKRAEPDMDHLMALCQGHTEDGMRGGHIWATAHRDEERDYIAKANQ